MCNNVYTMLCYNIHYFTQMRRLVCRHRVYTYNYVYIGVYILYIVIMVSSPLEIDPSIELERILSPPFICSGSFIPPSISFVPIPFLFSMRLSPSLCLWLSVSVSLPIYVYVSVCMSVCLSASLSLSLTVCPWFCDKTWSPLNLSPSFSCLLRVWI